MVEKAEKTTLMILNVDLQCSSCYKKVKKVICKFPQIRDQKYDEKTNKVFITVVCCDPEKIRDKLCCKGCGVIKSIEIVEPQKPQPRPAEKPKEPEKPKPPPEKPKEPEKPKPPPEKPKEPEKPKPPPEKPKEPEKPKPPPEKPKELEKPKEKPPAPPHEKPKEPPPKRPEPAPLPPPPHIPEPEPVMVMPCYPTYPPQGFCCGPCSAGIPGGPCYGRWYDRPPPPPPPPPRPCYEPFFGCRCGQSRNYYGCRCECNNYCQLDDSSCSIM